ncbi:GNAT family N-acetyltransferase [Jiulongibacter sp. NS-SX5]|uniref:GNAT family N-acetyltransferase n=1 Tax=Jiulongibacter sp. NS-SX5 TaxID=3463854 RepID=UPI004058BB33
MIREAAISEMDKAKELFREYEEWLGLDLCFQGFEEELRSLPGKYAEPEGSILFYETENEVAGIIALRALEKGICEMKRLYVRPEFRGNKIGRKLSLEIINKAKTLGYRKMKLDTLARLKPAVRIYRELGFTETKAYNYNPDETVMYFELDLGEWQK